jgi:hypothetical protein
LRYLKELVLTKIEIAFTPDDKELNEQMKDIVEFFIDQNKPETFAGKGDSIVKHEKHFESVLSSIQEAGIHAKGLTVFSFYSNIEYFEDKYEKMKKIYGIHK